MECVKEFKNLSTMVDLMLDELQIGSYSIELVLRLYKDPVRWYHDLRHLERMCEVLSQMDIKDRQKALIVLSIIYHDAIYDVGVPTGVNETASAALLMDAKYDIPEILEVMCAILDTNGHNATCDIGEVLVRLDLDHLINPLPEELDVLVIRLWKECGCPEWNGYIDRSISFIDRYKSQIGERHRNVQDYFRFMKGYTLEKIEGMVS